MHWVCGPLVLRAARSERTGASATRRRPDNAPNKMPCRSFSCAGRPAGRKSQIVALLTLLPDRGAFSKLAETRAPRTGPRRTVKTSIERIAAEVEIGSHGGDQAHSEFARRTVLTTQSKWPLGECGDRWSTRRVHRLRAPS